MYPTWEENLLKLNEIVDELILETKRAPWFYKLNLIVNYHIY